MTLLGIKYDSGWRNQPVRVKFDRGIYTITSEDPQQVSSFMFDKENNPLRRKVEYDPFFRHLSGEGHLFNHLGISVDLEIRIGEKNYKVLCRKGNDKVTLISGYTEAKDLSNIVNATNEELSEELLIESTENNYIGEIDNIEGRMILPGRRINDERIFEQKTMELIKSYEMESRDLGYGKFQSQKMLGYSDELHYLLIPLNNGHQVKQILNNKCLPRNFNIYFDGRTNGVQLVEKLRLELMSGKRRLEGESNLSLIRDWDLSFHHAEDKRIKKDEELHTFLHPLGIVLAEMEEIDEDRYRCIISEKLNGRFYVVENGKIEKCKSPHILSEKFQQKSSMYRYVDSDINLESYLRPDKF